jgi:hypothetical protein
MVVVAELLEPRGPAAAAMVAGRESAPPELLDIVGKRRRCAER